MGRAARFKRRKGYEDLDALATQVLKDKPGISYRGAMRHVRRQLLAKQPPQRQEG